MASSFVYFRKAFASKQQRPEIYRELADALSVRWMDALAPMMLL